MEPTSINVVSEQTADGRFIGRYEVYFQGRLVIKGKTDRWYDTDMLAKEAACAAARLEWQTRPRR